MVEIHSSLVFHPCLRNILDRSREVKQSSL
jgi:hypothetical protein